MICVANIIEVCVWKFLVICMQGLLTSYVVQASTDTIACNFESSICGYTQDFTHGVQDDFDWTRHRGSTPSSHTGPDRDHTFNNATGHYMYMEASSPASEGFSVRLQSRGYHTPATPQCLEFWYHMHGAHIGSLHVYFNVTNHAQSTVFSLHGTQNNSWHVARVPLPAGTKLQVVFEGIRGPGFRGDIAIDDIIVLHSPCSHTQIDVIVTDSSSPATGKTTPFTATAINSKDVTTRTQTMEQKTTNHIVPNSKITPTVIPVNTTISSASFLNISTAPITTKTTPVGADSTSTQISVKTSYSQVKSTITRNITPTYRASENVNLSTPSTSSFPATSSTVPNTSKPSTTSYSSTIHTTSNPSPKSTFSAIHITSEPSLTSSPASPSGISSTTSSRSLTLSLNRTINTTSKPFLTSPPTTVHTTSKPSLNPHSSTKHTTSKQSLTSYLSTSHTTSNRSTSPFSTSIQASPTSTSPITSKPSPTYSTNSIRTTFKQSPKASTNTIRTTSKLSHTLSSGSVIPTSKMSHTTNIRITTRTTPNTSTSKPSQTMHSSTYLSSSTLPISILSRSTVSATFATTKIVSTSSVGNTSQKSSATSTIHASSIPTPLPILPTHYVGNASQKLSSTKHHSTALPRNTSQTSTVSSTRHPSATTSIVSTSAVPHSTQTSHVSSTKHHSTLSALTVSVISTDTSLHTAAKASTNSAVSVTNPPTSQMSTSHVHPISITTQTFSSTDTSSGSSFKTRKSSLVRYFGPTTTDSSVSPSIVNITTVQTSAGDISSSDNKTPSQQPQISTPTSVHSPTTVSITAESESTTQQSTTLANTPRHSAVPVTTVASMPYYTLAPIPRVCASCIGSPEICEVMYENITCQPPDHYCINHVINTDAGTRSVERGCGNFHTCYNNWYVDSSDNDKCRRFDEASVVTVNFECTYCCVEDGCNIPLHPGPNTLYKDRQH